MGTVRSLIYLCIILVAACGRIAFDERTATVDAVDAPSRPPPTFVANAGATAEATASTLRVNVPTTTLGNLLVVTFTIHTDAAVTSIVDDGGNTYVAAGTRASMAGTSSEVWYADQRAPATAVDVTLDKVGSFNAYTLELAGVSGSPAKKRSACLLYR